MKCIYGYMLRRYIDFVPELLASGRLQAWGVLVNLMALIQAGHCIGRHILTGAIINAASDYCVSTTARTNAGHLTFLFYLPALSPRRVSVLLSYLKNGAPATLPPGSAAAEYRQH
jgi:hypothetical protein